MEHRRIGSAIAVLASLVAGGCTDGNLSSPTTPAVTLPSASSKAPRVFIPVRRLRRLSNREYNNVVRDLLGDTTRPANHFLVDVYQNGYDNGSVGLSVQSDQVVDYQAAAEGLAAAAVQSGLSQLLGGCDPAAQGDHACVESLLSSFAERAYRRPLTEPERKLLRDVFQQEAKANGFVRGIETILEVILQSPQFLYREELGPIGVVPPSGSDLRLTDGEVASELSFLITGSIPDADLRAAVAQGSLATVDDYQREAARLLTSQGAKDTLRAFLHQWLATDRLAGLSKDAAFYPTFSGAMAASMASELDAFFDSVLWQGSASLRELFTSSQSFADATLAPIYGVPVTGTGLLPVSLDPQIRPGILSRAGFLAVHSATDSSGPIERGVFVLRSIMCSPPPPPPAKVPPAPPANDPSVQNLSTRQRFGQHVSSPFCASCHTRIDGVGFGFEEFDGIGAYRDVDNGQPVDSSGSIVGTGEIDGDFHGVGELSTRLSGSHLLADCYARQAYRFAMGEVEPSESDLRWLTSASSADANMTAALVAIIGSPEFVTRRVE